MSRTEPYESPPTVDQVRAQGPTGFFVTCDRCRHSADMGFDALAIPGDLAFPAIRQARRFVCRLCGGRAVHVMPDWRGHSTRATEPPGAGRIMPP